MANEVNANIRLNLDSSQALASLRTLQSQISTFNQSVIQSNAQAAAAQRGLVSTLSSQIGATRKFSTSMTQVETGVGRLQGAIDTNKLSMREYFKFGVASSKTFGKVFKQEHIQMTALATERVKRLQTQYLALGAAQNGVTKAMAVRPMHLFNADMAIGVQRQQLFNKLLTDGSTSILNWGKNTQWAGRQLMVGFTIPLTIFGAAASKVFMGLEKEAINFRKVYGDIFTTDVEVEENLSAIKELSSEMTKYGIAVKDTMELAGVAAQAGLRSSDLLAATTQATRLAVLGQMEQAEAMKTVISMQTAFQQSNDQLAESVDFLNIIENQTVLSLQDVAGAIPRVAPVIQGMGGDIKDLAILLVAMREGGVSAAEGANALKNSLARLIDPTTRAIKTAKEFGINLEGIVEKNRGEVLPTITELAQALGTLEGPDEQKLLATIFGKFQYARVGALMKNIRDDSSQAARAMDLMGMSAEQLAETADKELGVVEDAVSTKFTAAMEKAKLAIAPIGEIFLKIAIPILESLSKIFDKFNDLSPTVKNFITILIAGIGIAAPAIIMLVGLFGNLIGNGLKIIATIARLMSRLKGTGDGATYLAGTQLDAAAAASSLEGKTTTLTESLNIQASAVASLAAAYRSYVDGARAAAASLPQGFNAPITGAVPGGVAPMAMARGGLVPGRGNKDSVPALLMPGESVVTKEATEKFAPIISAMNAGTLQGLARGMTGDVSFSSLGTVSLASIYDQKSLIAIQKMADGLASAGENVQRSFMQIIENLSETQNLTKGMVEQAAKASSIPEIASMGSEVRYNATSAGERRSIEQQLNEDLSSLANSQEIARKELSRAQAASAGAVEAIDQYYDSLLQGATSQEQVEAIQKDRTSKLKSAQQIDRAHIVALENAEKTERAAWDARLWFPQSGIENQLSNMLASSEDNRVIYEQYLMNLSDSSVTEEQRMQILDKIGNNLGLTDTELDIQKVVLENILSDAEQNAILVQKINGEYAKLSSQFVPYAAGAIGAAEGRASLGPADPRVEAQRIAMSRQVVGGLRDDFQTASPSEVAANISQEVPRGVAKGIERGTPEAVAASKDMAKQVVGQLDLFNQDPVEAGGQLALLTKEEVQRAATRISPAGGVGGGGGSGSGGGPQFLGMPGMGPEGRNLSNAASQTAKELQKNTGILKKFGGGLVKGSRKLTGVSMGLSSVAFALSRVDGPIGEMAQKAMPVVLGLSSLQMILPLVASKFGLIAAPLIATAAAIWFFKSKADKMTENVSKMSNALIATRKSVEKVGEFYGKESVVAKQRADIIKEKTGVESEDLQQAKEFLESDIGKSMREGLATAMTELGASSAANQFAANLASLTLQGVMDPQQARAIAEALGESIEDQQFSANIQGRLTALFGPGDLNLLESPLRLAIEVDRQNVKTVEQITENIGEISDVFQEFTKFTEGDLKASIIPIFGGINLINKATLDWDNAIGRVARSARGILNVDDFEQQEEKLKMAGNIIGNQLAQSYDNLGAAQARYQKQLKKVRESEGKDAESKKEARRLSKELKIAQDMLTESISKQEDEYRALFSSMAGAGQVVALEGMRESLTQRFSDDPMLKMAYDILAGKITSSSADIQFNVNMGLLSGKLNPIAAQRFFDSFASNEEATSTLNLMITNSGIDTTNEMLIKILNMQDDELRKEAILDIVVNTIGDGSETAELLGEENPKVLARRELKKAKEEFAGNTKAIRLGDIISRMTQTRSELTDEISQLEQDALEASSEREKQNIQNRINRLNQNIKKLDANISEKENQLNSLRARVVAAQKAYDETVGIGEKLRGRSAARYQQTMGTPEERLAARQDFRFEKDVAKSKGIDISIKYEGMSAKDLNETNANLEIFNKFPEDSLKILEIDTIADPKRLAEMTEGYKNLESTKPKVVKQAIMDVMGGEGESATKAIEKIKEMGYSMKEFAALPNSTKYNILYNVKAEIELDIKITSLDNFIQGMPSGAADRISEAQDRLGNLKTQLAEIQDLISSLNKKTGKDDLTDKPGGDTGSGSGGGSKEKSFLEELLENIEANAKLYLNLEGGLQGYLKNRGKFIGALKKLRKQGIPEEIISQIGTGPEGEKKAKELENATKAERKKLIQGTRAIAVGAAINNLFETTSAGRKRVSAAKTIGGESDEIKEFAMADEKLVAAFATVKTGSKAYKALIDEIKESIKVKREEAEITQTQEEAQISANEAVIKALELEMQVLDLRAKQDFAAENGKTVDQVKEEIADREFLIKQYQRQIDEIERLNKKDQDRIDVLDRQKTLLDRQKDSISRQIEALERANEMDSRKAEQLKRQDEIRNRVADALSYELDLLSRQETKINESYDKRIKALEQVSKINEKLVSQQKKQLDLSRAIAEGDIYSATAAAQEMRAEFAEFSKEQTRDAMERAKELQVEGLRTESGLTRDQAEERIRDIKDASYQVGLRIRDIEDQIYNRVQLTIPLKDQIYDTDLKIRDIDSQILVINDLIYDRNLQIKAIEDLQIEPLVRQNTESQFILDKLDNRIREESRQHRERVNQLTQQNQFLSASVGGTRDLRNMTDQARGKADALSSSWRGVAKAARDAASAIGSTSIGMYAGGLMKMAMGGKIKKYPMGGLIPYAMGGKVKKYPMGGLIPYSMGGVAGDGGRDSVMAMLTPGEFVVRKSMVQKYGAPMMKAINQGSFAVPRYDVGERNAVSINSVGPSMANINAPVYNTYDMDFAIHGSNANADDIANKVMFKIKQIQSQTIRGNRGY